MNIIVCIKQVPDTKEVRIDPVKGTLIRQGVPSIMNPDDKAALEAALRIKDALGANVIAVSMGPMQADAVLREALAMGADEAILVSDPLFGGADTWATSATLAATITKLEYDLVLTGRQAIDGDTAQVGPEIAEHLGIPHISYAKGLQIEGDKVIVRRQFEDRYQILSAKMPALVTTLSEINQPRYMTPRGIFEAYREKQVTHWQRTDIPVESENIGLKGSPTRVIDTSPKVRKSPGTKIEEDVDKSVQFLIDKLKEKYIL
jgi:electron transfer flavoprotein beta subunit